MIWESPTWLFAMWLIPLVGLACFYAQRKRQAAARQFADPAMVERLMPEFSASRIWVKAILVMLALAAMIVSVARPRYGVYFEEVSGKGVDLFVLLDVSKSMLAEDVAPNRLDRAKADIVDLLSRLQGDRVGLLTFAGAPVVQVPLTTDQGYFRMVLNEVDTDSAPRGGSLIGDAIRKGMDSMEERRDRDQVFVLITDGEDHDSFPIEAAQRAADRNIRIITVGLGDVGEGARIPRRSDGGGLAFLRHDGQEIWSKMDERLLKEIALKTSGAYIPAQTKAYDLGRIYDDHLAQLTRGEIQAEKRKRYREQFQVFGVLGLMLLVIDSCVSHVRVSDHSSEAASA